MAKHAGVGGPVNGVGGPAPGRDQHQRTPAAGPKHAGSTRAGIPRIVGLAVLAGIAATAFVIISRLNSATPDRAAPESPSTSSSPLESPATEAPGTSTMPTTAVQPAPSLTVGSAQATLTGPPSAPLPQTGPGLTQPGILLVASPAADGSFDVLERIRLANPVSVLTLRPAPVDRAGQLFASASAAATQVQVKAGDQPVVVPGAKVGARIDLPVAEVDQFELRYRLTDVTVISTPSKAGRALAAIGPLTGGVADDLPVLFIVTGETILGLNCPLLPLSQQSCGSRVQTGPSIEHELPWRLALTSVQFNLPPA
jgi:hypothetical protein